MGKGRTTTGMIVATLMADIAQVQQCQKILSTIKLEQIEYLN